MTPAEADNVSYRFEWKVPEGLDPAALPMVHELVRRGRRNENLGDEREKQRQRWAGLQLVLGIPAAVLAGVSEQ